jgi:hypothetical protein
MIPWVIDAVPNTGPFVYNPELSPYFGFIWNVSSAGVHNNDRQVGRDQLGMHLAYQYQKYEE